MTVRAPRSVLDVCERFDASVFEELFIVADVSFEEAERAGGRGRAVPRARSARAAGTTASWAATRTTRTSASAAATCSTRSGYVEPGRRRREAGRVEARESRGRRGAPDSAASRRKRNAAVFAHRGGRVAGASTL